MHKIIVIISYFRWKKKHTIIDDSMPVVISTFKENPFKTTLYTMHKYYNIIEHIVRRNIIRINKYLVAYQNIIIVTRINYIYPLMAQEDFPFDNFESYLLFSCCIRFHIFRKTFYQFCLKKPYIQEILDRKIACEECHLRFHALVTCIQCIKYDLLLNSTSH